MAPTHFSNTVYCISVMLISTIILQLRAQSYSFGAISQQQKKLDYNTIYKAGNYRERPYQNRKHKVEYLGEILKKHVESLRRTFNGQVELVFLVDSSTSVGMADFENELTFVKKLLADFTVDKDTTRVAVVTFSSHSRIIRVIDHLSNPDNDHHKCSLLEEELPRVSYRGGGTHTIGAFQEAQEIFQSARPNAQKVLFLITDGYSNGGDPRPLAENLRDQGVKIFTIGIRNGNPDELKKMASDPSDEHCYILDDFEEFGALARRALHEDLSMGNFIKQTAGKCGRLCAEGGDCCDARATCRCGTHTGKYNCICNKGFYGNGLIGGCKPCPRGTFKSSSLPGGINTCVACPDVHHSSPAGSVSIHHCRCQRGYRSIGKYHCEAMTCPKLKPPENGRFVNQECNNVFNAACGVQCDTGYKLEGNSLRLCQENGRWSGTTSFCQVKKCKKLDQPKNGKMMCTKDDFSFGTTCEFRCDAGYKLIGTRTRTCLAIAFWNGIPRPARCQEITCKALPKLSDGKVAPSYCTNRSMPFGTTCSLTCRPGYKMLGPHNRQCQENGRWTGSLTENKCIDVAPPVLTCSKDLTVETLVDENHARATWDLPLAVDNSGYLPQVSVIPAVIPPTLLPIGVNAITYVAQDAASNKISCSFNIIVVDKQPPRIDKCISPSPFILRSKEKVHIDWEEPIFSDNSRGSLEIQRSHSPGEDFPIGKTKVTYTAYDRHGNNNTCIIEIVLQEHACANPPVPQHGNITCTTHPGGVECFVSCHKGYGFALPPAEFYMCDYISGKWTPYDNSPFPDCSASVMSNHVIQRSKVVFRTTMSCDDRLLLNQIETTFNKRVTYKVNEYCDPNVICSVELYATECSSDEYEITNEIFTNEIDQNFGFGIRKKRSSPKGDMHNLKLAFQVAGSFRLEVNDIDANDQLELRSKVSDVVSRLKDDVTSGQLDTMMADVNLELETLAVEDIQPRFMCDQGSVIRDKMCVQCPSGTFFNVVSESCEGCPIGTYQPSGGNLTCLVCPNNTSTASNNSKTIGQCKGQCLPGSFSSDGLDRCETCDLGYYQSDYAQTQCLSCPDNSTTWRRGTRDQEECGVMCKKGHISKTGLEPCFPCPRGYFQPHKGKSSCVLCPGNVKTKEPASIKVTDCEGIDSEDEAIEQYSVSTTDLVINECFAEPCLNNATCRSLSVSYTCLCQPGWSGLHCETEIDECQSLPCLNNATCFDLFNNFTCECQPGYTGGFCGINIDECGSGPCFGGSTCVDEIDGFHCVCPLGFNGTYCEIDIDDCADSPCENNATCVDATAGYSCDCSEGFQGENCEINVDECASSPCLNNGTCQDADNMFRCVCVDGFVGDMCQIEVNECDSSPCHQGATCFDQVNNYLCRCPPSFNGRQCENYLSSDFHMKFTTSGITDYVSLENMYSNITELTITFWMKTSDKVNYGTVLSYATNQYDNAITIMDYNGFVFKINNNTVITDVTGNDDKWHHITVTWTSQHGNWQIYKDGTLEQHGSDLANGTVIQGGGVIVLGQEQDRRGGSFNAAESYIGEMAQVQVWDVLLSSSDINGYITTCQQYDGSVIAWPDFLSGVNGRVEVTNSSFCQECPAPPPIVHGAVSHNGTVMESSVATYSCDTGYDMDGEAQSRCRIYSDWEGKPPKCRLHRCGYPGSIQHGYISDGFMYSYGSIISYQCDAGYRIKGNSSITCLESGWSDALPECQEIFCLKPDISLPVRIPSAAVEYRPGQNIKFSCASGYKLLGSRTSECGQNGEWKNLVPKCDQIRCINPPSIENGKPLSGPNDLVNVNDNVNYKCNVGYVLSTKAALRCREDGTWADNTPRCDVVTCLAPLAVTNGVFSVKKSNEYKDYAFGTKIIYSCQNGYIRFGNYILMCGEQGEWNDTFPVCKPINCPKPKMITNGYIVGNSFVFKASITYVCDTGFELIGQGTKTCLQTGVWSGEVPVCQPVECPTPEPIEHGMIQGDTHTFGQLIAIICKAGYTIKGPDIRMCRENGEWEVPFPECLPVQCPTPFLIDNGHVIGKQFAFKDTLEYTCDAGYHLKGNKKRICLADAAWSGETPYCQRVKCSDPPSVKHGQLNTKLQEYEPGSVVSYSCNVGYELQGKHSRTCREEGIWSGPMPKCTTIQCSSPHKINNGYVSSQSTLYGSTAKYDCEEGYQLDGPKERTCSEDKRWAGTEPICEMIMCSEPEDISYGVYTGDIYNAGSSVEYTCQHGFNLVGNATRTCQENRTWSGELPWCKPVHCSEPIPTIPNGRMINSNFSYTANIQYVCDPGYYINGTSERECGADAEWLGDTPVCARIECPAPGAQLHFDIKGNDYRYKEEIRYVCHEGFELIGADRRMCQSDQTWSGKEPDCVKIQCPEPAQIANGKVLLQGLFHKNKAKYICDPGYNLIGEVHRHCGRNRTWLGEEPRCRKIKCGKPPSFPDATPMEDELEYGDEATYRCTVGHVLESPVEIYCTLYGNYSEGKPVCVRIKCEQPENIENGFIIKDGNSYGDVINYTCKTGYGLLGVERRICREDGKWSGIPPKCIINVCSDPLPLHHGEISAEHGYTYGSIIQYDCHDGHRLVGIVERKCEANKTWSGQPPVCEPLECAKPDVEFGYVAFVVGGPGAEEYVMTIDKLVAGMIVQIECERGYSLIGNEELTCLSNMTWNPGLPSCEPVHCPEISVPHSIVQAESLTFGHRMKVTCVEGYTLIGTADLICGADGDWSEPPPSCDLIKCPPPRFKNGNITVIESPLGGIGYPYGITLKFACHIGHIIKGSNVLSCGGNGSWNNDLPYCKPTLCVKPELNDKYLTASPTPQEYKYHEKVRFKCEDDYETKGPNEIICNHGGVWSGHVPVCIRKECPSINLTNGRIFTELSKIPTNFYTGIDVEFVCDVGWKLVGASSSQCKEDKTWSTLVPSCLQVTCPRPEIDHSIIMPSSDSKKYIYGSAINIMCTEGWSLVGDEKLVCLGSGKWSKTIPTCRRVKCPAVTVAHSEIVKDGEKNNHVFGDTIQVYCNTGYELFGGRELSCRADGTWSVEIPACEAIHCVKPQVSHGGVQVITNASATDYPYVFGTDIRFDCDKGYNLAGTNRSSCQANGTWAPVPPICQPVICPELSLPNGNIATEERTYLTQVNLTCMLGYELLGSRELVCGHDAKWKGTLPTCVHIQCPSPGIQHGSVVPGKGRVSSAFMFGDSVRFECHDGWELIGEQEMVCQPNRTWSGPIPYCQIVSCINLPDIKNSKIEFSNQGMISNLENITYGSEIRVSCLRGYDLHGDDTFTCGPDGSWSGTFPKCKKVTCGVLVILNGVAKGTASGYDGSYAYQDEITFSCDEGFKLIGDHTLHCSFKGEWNSTFPQCEQITCSLPNISNSNIRGVANGKGGLFVFRDSVQLFCDEGYLIIGGAREAVCLPDGTWSDKLGVCERQTCLEPSIDNGEFVGSSYKYLDRIKYICHTGFELVGPAEVRCEADQTWTFKSYCRPIRCSLPTRLMHGYYKVTGYKYKDKVRYFCDEGYQVEGESDHKCLANKAWGGIMPRCLRIKCITPKPIENGQLIGSSHFFGDTIKYTCDAGFNLHGDKIAKCLATKQWSGSLPECHIVSCGEPDHVDHATLEGKDWNYGDTVEYVCDIGYELHGHSKRKCSRKGTWKNGIPSCEPVPCSEPDSIPNGFAIEKGNVYGSELVYQCRKGFELNGIAHHKCLSNGTWSGTPPTCEINDCGTPRNVTNGYTVGLETFYGSVIEYMCDFGYELHGLFTRMCKEDKTWSGDTPTCKKVSCPTPKRVSNGYFEGSDYRFGSWITYHCDSNYVLVGETRRMCQADMSWTGYSPVCKLKTCPRPSTQEHTQMLGYSGKLGPGSRLTFVCDQGYELIGEELLTCLDGKHWSGEVPLCDKVSCGLPKPILNAVMNGNSYEFGDTVQYKCMSGYQIEGNSKISCEARGEWSPLLAECVPISCGPPPVIPHTFISGEGHQFGDYVYYACIEGYDMDGSNILQCDADGSWAGDMPYCKMVTCGHVPVIHRASTIVIHSTYGSKATYRCNRGYILQGSPTVECMINGTWMYKKKPRCVPVNCGPPPDVAGGNVIFPDTTLGNIAKYSCDRDYKMIPDEVSLQCGSEGKWSGDSPECVLLTCPALPSLEGGHVLGDELTINSTVVFICHAGYVLLGNNTLTCESGGEWSRSPPMCAFITCPELTVPPGASSDSKATHHNTTVTFTCQPGLILDGSHTTTCLQNGKWSSLPPVCKPKVGRACPPPYLPDKAIEPKGKAYTGDSLTLVCMAGYSPSGNMTIVCQDNLTWTSHHSYCARVYCGPLSQDRSMLVFGRAFYYGDRLVYRCRAGYSPQRTPIVTCTASGQWDHTPQCKATCKYPCHNGGTCIGLNKCKCKPGFSGRFCKHAICIMPCLHGGRCVGPYQCQCPPGFSGARCQYPVCNRQCANGGKCVLPNRCSCPHMYRPPFCEPSPVFFSRQSRR